MKKLIEEIYRLVWNYVEGDCGISDIITLIGKAYADGELMLPNQVGRKDMCDWIDRLDEDDIGQADLDEQRNSNRRWVSLMTAKKATQLIALRLLSGTGKEED